jgi:hypothetical protein
MATRYWVGGSGNWDATSTTNWAATSGGASGASAPTAVDDVIFDANSNTLLVPFTVTVTGTSGAPALCQDFSTGGAGGALDAVMTFTVASASSQINISGSLTLPASNVVWTTGAAFIVMVATSTGKTITTNGITITGSIRFDGAGGEWTLGSAYTTTSSIILTNGSFVTNNYNVTSTASSGFNFSIAANSNTKAVTLGSSTVTLASSSPFSNASTGGLTFNAGTSQITCSNATATFAGGGLTFYNVSFTATVTGTTTINGANTFNNLTIVGPAAGGRRGVAVGGNQIVNGTLTLNSGSTGIRRMPMYTTTAGTQRTITVNTAFLLSDVDFQYIGALGTAGTWTGTRLGDGKGNSGITFDAPKNVYWNLVAGGNWSATAWALSSGGAVNVNNFPLTQDIAIIENTGLNTSATVTVDSGWQVGSINMSTRSNAMTFNVAASFFFWGDLTLSSAITLSGTQAINFSNGTGTQTITSAGRTLTQPLSFGGFAGTVTLADNVTTSNTVTLTSGTLNLNDKTLTCNIFSGTGTNTRDIAFGTGNITLTGNSATILNCGTGTNMTVTGTPVINATYSGSTGTRRFDMPALNELNSISINVTAGSDGIDLRTSNGTYKNLNFTGFSGAVSLTFAISIYGNLTTSSGMTWNASTNAITFAATSGTQQITSNGKTLDFPITHNGVGGTVQLQDNLTIGSTRTFTLTNGTLNVNSKTLSAGAFSSSNSNARTIGLGTNGKITVNGGGWTTTTSTNLSLTGTGTIDMTYGTAKTFAGGSAVYPYTLNQGGAGALTITGNNQFANISNTVQPATITFTAGSTTSVQDFTVSGTAGNLVTLNSSSAGTKFNLALV